MHRCHQTPLTLLHLARCCVTCRKNKSDIYTQINAFLNQYDNEDFDLGIKQFMMEQAIQHEMEDGVDKRGNNKEYEEKLAEELFADEGDVERQQVITSGAAGGLRLVGWVEKRGWYNCRKCHLLLANAFVCSELTVN